MKLAVSNVNNRIGFDSYADLDVISGMITEIMTYYTTHERNERIKNMDLISVALEECVEYAQDMVAKYNTWRGITENTARTNSIRDIIANNAWNYIEENYYTIYETLESLEILQYEEDSGVYNYTYNPEFVDTGAETKFITEIAYKLSIQEGFITSHTLNLEGLCYELERILEDYVYS